MSGKNDQPNSKDNSLNGGGAEEKQKRRLDVSPAQVTGGALASVTAAFLGSQLGSAGTIVGAGMTSVVITLGGALYQRSLENAKDKAKVAANKAVVLRQRRPSAPTTVFGGPGAAERVDQASGAAGISDASEAPTAAAPAARDEIGAPAVSPFAGQPAHEPGQHNRGEADNMPTRRADRPPGMVWPGGEQVVDEEPARSRSAECFDRGHRQRTTGDAAGTGNTPSTSEATSATGNGASTSAAPSTSATHLGRGSGMRKLRWDGTQYVPRESGAAMSSGQTGRPPGESPRARRADGASEPPRATGNAQPGARSSGGTAVARQSGSGVELADEVAPAPRRRNGLRWAMLAVSSALIFVLGMLVVTGYEMVAGKPLSGGDSGTTVGRAFHPQPAPEPDPVPDEGAETTEPSTEPAPTGTDEPGLPGDPAESDGQSSDGSTSSEPPTSTGSESDGSSATEGQPGGASSGNPMPGAPGAGSSGQNDESGAEQSDAGMFDGGI